MVSESRKIQHLMWRAGCGITPTQYTQLGNSKHLQIVDKLFSEAKGIKPIALEPGDLMDKAQFKKASKQEKKKLKKLARKRIKNINHECLRRLAFEKGELGEKMTIFWHNHFSSFTIFPGWILKQNNLIRKHALGSFRNLIMGVSKNPVMLTYLNNQQNKKGHPNENFAREVMELFTLGRGNYSEKDIQEAARAFTGWSTTLKGEFEFKEYNHDDGEKVFFGNSGKFSGEDIIDMILDKREAAKYITTKIYRDFVNVEINPEHIETLAKNFYESDYNIEKLMREIFTSDWFYDEKNMGAKVKSPIDLLTGLMKSFNLEFNDANSLIKVEKIMGQVLFNPPNVAGWPGGLNWIDSSSLMFRLRMAEFIFNNAEIDYEPKEDIGMEMGELGNRMADNPDRIAGGKVSVKTNISEFLNQFGDYDEGELFDRLADYLIVHQQTPLDRKVIEKHLKKGNKAERITGLTVMMLSTPQYQLC